MSDQLLELSWEAALAEGVLHVPLYTTHQQKNLSRPYTTAVKHNNHNSSLPEEQQKDIMRENAQMILGSIWTSIWTCG